MATYYKTIKGIRYDKEMLEAADEAVSGKKDGRISINDAKKIINKALDGPGITEVESRTLQYIYDNYNFTPSSKEHFATYLTSDTETKPVTKSVKEEEPAPVAHHAEKDERIDEDDKVEEAVTEVKGFFARYYLLIIIIALILFLLYLYSDRLLGCMGNDGKSIDAVNNAVKIEKLENENDKAVQIPENVISQESKEVVAGENEYIIKAKDTLFSISSKIYGDPDKWKKLYEKNKDSIEDPAMIFPGQKLQTDIK